MRIGSIGLGIMGSRMAANLRKCGHSLVVHNRTSAKAESLLAKGAEWADSPAELAPNVEMLFTILAHPDAVKQAALVGENGFLPHLPPGRLWVDCSTVNPSFSRSMAAEAQARRVRFLGAPVTGSKEQAAAGKLIFWVGGESFDLEASTSSRTPMRPITRDSSTAWSRRSRRSRAQFGTIFRNPDMLRRKTACRRKGHISTSGPGSLRRADLRFTGGLLCAPID